MTYDKNINHLIRFVGGPFDGKDFSVVPADRLVHNQNAPDGSVLKRHTYNLREYLDESTGKMLKLEYIYQP